MCGVCGWCSPMRVQIHGDFPHTTAASSEAMYRCVLRLPTRWIASRTFHIIGYADQTRLAEWIKRHLNYIGGGARVLQHNVPVHVMFTIWWREDARGAIGPTTTTQTSTKLIFKTITLTMNPPRASRVRHPNELSRLIKKLPSFKSESTFPFRVYRCTITCQV